MVLGLPAAGAVTRGGNAGDGPVSGAGGVAALAAGVLALQQAAQLLWLAPVAARQLAGKSAAGSPAPPILCL